MSKRHAPIETGPQIEPAGPRKIPGVDRIMPSRQARAASENLPFAANLAWCAGRRRRRVGMLARV